MEPGSPPESTASRASSNTGVGGHQTSSLSSSSLLLVLVLGGNLRVLRHVAEDLVVGEEKGTRNLKQEWNCWAISGLTEEACWWVPRRESKSDVVALGGVELLLGLKRKKRGTE